MPAFDEAEIARVPLEKTVQEFRMTSGLPIALQFEQKFDPLLHSNT
jgi:hypothetical protein